MKKHRFNELKPPKPIHVIAACVLELVDDPTTPALCAERFIDGADRFGRGFVKWAPVPGPKFTSVVNCSQRRARRESRLKGFPRRHNNNSGFVDHDEHRSTPQAFSSAQIKSSGASRRDT